MRSAVKVVKLHHSASAPPAGPEQPERPAHHRPRRWLAAALVVLGIASAGTLADYWLRARAVPPPVVFLEPVTRGPVAAHLRLTGTLRPAEVHAITQPSAGRATDVSVRVGSSVTAGQVVMRFDPLAQRVELARVESRLVTAEAQALGAELMMSRLQRGPQSDDADSEDALAIAYARLATANAEVEAHMAAYQLAQRQLRDRVVRAPVAGVVISREVEPGQTIDAGAPLLVIASAPHRLRLVAEAPEPALAQVANGQVAQFTVPAFPGRTFRARVEQRGPLTGPPGARRFPIELEVDNADDDLTFGMSASVEIDLSRTGPVLRVPLAALSFAPTPEGGRDDQAIWTGSPRGSSLVRVPVEVGTTDERYAEVRAGLLSEGDMVAVAFARRPKP